MKRPLTLYEILDITEKELCDIISSKASYYTTYSIRKSNGKKRYIDAPRGKLKELQYSLLDFLLYKFTASSIAHGFVKYRSPITNAKKHVGAKILVKVDIANFFNNISYRQVISLFQSFLLRYQPNVLTFINQAKEVRYIAEVLTYKNKVPQGAPTSPTISNLICLGLDKDLIIMGKEFDCKVTRYAD